jgi:magnesium transporter
MKQPDLRELLRGGDAEALDDFCRTTDPAGAANLLTGLGVAEIWDVLSHTDRTRQVAIVHHLPHQKKVALVLSAAPERLARLLEVMPAHDRYELLKDVQPELLEEELLPLVEQAQREDIRRLLSYPKDSAGSAMTTDYAWLPDGLTATEALTRLRHQATSRQRMYNVYVLDDQRRLVGVLDLSQLILAPATAKLSEFMTRDFVSVPIDLHKEQAAKKLADFHLVALPVVDNDNRLVGVLTHDDLMDVVIAAATEDMLRMGAVEPGALDMPYMATSFPTMVKKRATWLVILFLSEMLTATAMGFFEGEISKATVLALFVPLVISSGGNSGSQAATLIIRALALQEIRLRDWWRVMRREVYSGLMLGGILGSLGFLRIAIWQQSHLYDYGAYWLRIGFTVGFSLIGIVMWGTLSGSMLPLLLKRCGLDPATSSAPFVATMVDVTGLVIYFSVALLVLRGALL